MSARDAPRVVLEGSGRARPAGATVRIGPGDCVALPASPACAHSVENDGDRPLRSPCISAMVEPDIGVYPDSNEVGLFAGSPPGGDPARRVLAFLGRAAEVDTWAGEP